MAADDGSVVLSAGEGKTVSFSGNRVRAIHGPPGGAYSVVEWAAQTGVTGTPLHVQKQTDEAFYVLEGTFGFLAGERAFEGGAGAFVFVPKGLEHAYWNAGKTRPRCSSPSPRLASSATSRSWPKAWRRRETTSRRSWACARRCRRSTT